VSPFKSGTSGTKIKEEKLASIEERVESLVKPTIEKIGYELYDVEYAKEGKNYFLRIFIDKPEGIDLSDCEKVNDAINDILDEADYIKEQYFLEVSSPGVERILRKDKHLKQNIGKEVNVKLFKKDENGKKEYQGILQEFSEEKIIIENNTKIEIERKNIAQIKTIYNW
jgi:ribosome maturation factor RimP